MCQESVCNAYGIMSLPSNCIWLFPFVCSSAIELNYCATSDQMDTSIEIDRLITNEQALSPQHKLTHCPSAQRSFSALCKNQNFACLKAPLARRAYAAIAILANGCIHNDIRQRCSTVALSHRRYPPCATFLWETRQWRSSAVTTWQRCTARTHSIQR